MSAARVCVGQSATTSSRVRGPGLLKCTSRDFTYALAILGVAPVNDRACAKQRQAAALLYAVLPKAPNHPGVAHYLIHSFDYPPLAELALSAARAYSMIAPPGTT